MDWTLKIDFTKYFVAHHILYILEKRAWGVGFNSLTVSKYFKYENSCLAFHFSC